MQPYAVAPKNAVVHALISFFLPGLGSLTAGGVVGGLVIGCLFWFGVPIAWVVTFVAASAESSVTWVGWAYGTVGAFALWVTGVFHAYTSAQSWNRRRGILS